MPSPVAVISSSLSKMFGNFYHNKLDEEAFVEHFLGGLRKENTRLFEVSGMAKIGVKGSHLPAR
jgi:hypothetical protein